MTRIGYARVSTREQNLDLQVAALKKAGCEKIFTDEGISGIKAYRPGLAEALAYLREGDTLVVWKFDRLGRSTKNLLMLVEDELKPRKVEFISLTEKIDTSSALGKMFFTITTAFAEMERNIIHERTVAGLEQARARGRLGGRPKKLTPQQKRAIKALYADRGSMPVREIAKQFGVGRSTVYELLKESVADSLTVEE